MFRRYSAPAKPNTGFPRIRGDVPFTGTVKVRPIGFSPHTRGCSAVHLGNRQAKDVFPAYAGMFRLNREARGLGASFPRIRGDVPVPGSLAFRHDAFSPHTRGCSAAPRPPPPEPWVFPAYAGMFRSAKAATTRTLGFPRIRGDVPPRSGNSITASTFSPHTRGCSGSR